MNFSIELISAVIGGAVASGICITLAFLLFGKSIKKSKQSNLAKELKNNKELETTSTAKLLDSFNVEQEQIDNFVIAEKSKKKELSEKDKKKATKFKI